MPDRWRMGAFTVAGAVVGVAGLMFAAGVVAAANYLYDFRLGEVRSLAFVTLVFAGQATVYAIRERGHLWDSRPGGWLVLSSLLDLTIAAGLAVTGTLMAPLSISTIAVLLACTALYALVLDVIKGAVFKRLGI